MPRFLSVVAFLAATLACEVEACSTFLLKTDTGAILGQNYDWDAQTGMVVVNPSKVLKRGFWPDNPPEWVARHASITACQYGRDFPNGGMNEAGLAVAVMWNEATKYPAADERNGLHPLQWVQYQLDTASNVEEVLASTSSIRPVNDGVGVTLHFLIGDVSGRAAVVAYLDGKLKVFADGDLPACALTNHTYLPRDYTLLQGWTPPASFDTARDTLSLGNSRLRWLMLAEATRRHAGIDHAEAPSRAKDTLLRVRQGDYSKWHLVWDLKERAVHFSSLEAPETKSLSLEVAGGRLTGIGALAIDLNAPQGGPAEARLVPLTMEMNQSFLERAEEETASFLPIPNFLVRQIAAYPSGHKAAP